ncbi:ArdC-like ssDNA-binding domain-containing protein [Thermus sp. NEB1569]|uniref:ArdC-like ssDNA-binding domain-containing protein n=1 Tax=Thermus sp. NEB1569 TaxID=2918899 RepID=UPI001EFBA4D9|nr:ArdC-like ssDNA-binding domain-containing protein [Thermus sp. NEB1569]ULR39694.1 ArdC-like ssDNA-binding domain-containing protein [Thermus sp. NEB1569]
MKDGNALLKHVHDTLTRLAHELAQGHTEAFLDYLKAMGRFHRYSFRNTLLIWLQKPEATLVAGLRTWNELGRRVRKGEKGIRILAPVVRRVVEVDEEGKEVEVEQVVGFRTAVVFDISQTEGQPLPEPPMNRGSEDLFPRLLEACPFRVVEASLGERHGDTDGQVIRVNRDLPPGEKAATLLHEWAHALLHFDEAGRGLPRGVKELEAEAVAYAVGTRLGLEMVGARDYILSWAGREAQDLLREVLPRLYRAVEAILGQVEVGKAQAA